MSALQTTSSQMPFVMKTTILPTETDMVKSSYLKLNVGGVLFHTTIATLCKQSNNMLCRMFSGDMETTIDNEGWVLIDRDGKHFGKILNYLRDGSIPLDLPKHTLHELLVEAQYYCLTALTLEIENLLCSHEQIPTCLVPVITNVKEEQQLIAESDKPVIKFLYNRQNNKYSYTSNSDENILKNIELFDKLSLRFHERILFIKDVLGCNEICCWMFYGHRRKVSEVCCTSIVYTTEKKQTKIEYPEAKIYEETLNALLFEKGRQPDNQLLQATRYKIGGHRVMPPTTISQSMQVSDDETDRRH